MMGWEMSDYIQWNEPPCKIAGDDMVIVKRENGAIHLITGESAERFNDITKWKGVK